ncbi:hypothetical protein NC651_006250 [Populus alba x Populus x berolinensis]|nr:hypothetical protein NC651_006250 [Populus alba x Populus x berolinensis]
MIQISGPQVPFWRAIFMWSFSMMFLGWGCSIVDKAWPSIRAVTKRSPDPLKLISCAIEC